jgi:CRISPR-associated endoribonuclease Cas6
LRVIGQLELKEPQFPLDYRPTVLSLFKKGLSDYSGGEFFKEFYDGTAATKPLCFAVGFPHEIQFEKDRILLPACNTHIQITFSSGDVQTGIVMYNALCCRKGKNWPLPSGNTMTLTKLYMPPEKLVHNTSLIVKALSPICVRVKEGEKEHYASVAQPDFEEKLREQLIRRFRGNHSITDEMLKTFHFLPLHMRKTVVLHYRQKIECSVGTATISGSPELLYELYENGLGSRCSAGYGLLQILQQR